MLNHDIFYNRERSGYEELFSYMPAYWKQIKEMRANISFAGYTTERMAEALERVVLDQFFDTCSEEMIQRELDFLQLTDYGNLSIDDKRNLLKVSWIGNQKMSGTRIKALVRAYCGCNSDVKFDHELYIMANISESSSNIYLGDLQKIFSKQIPAHISWYAIMEITSNSINIGRSICYWNYDYAKCGTNPDVSTLGEAIETDFQVDTTDSSYLYEQEKTGTVVTGTTPRIGTIGVSINTSVELVNDTNQYIHEHEKTGDLVTGVYPNTVTIGSVSIAEVDIHNDAESHIYEMEKCSKNEGEEEN